MRHCIRPLIDGPDDEESMDAVKCDCEWPVFYRKARVKKRKRR